MSTNNPGSPPVALAEASMPERTEAGLAALPSSARQTQPLAIAGASTSPLLAVSGLCKTFGNHAVVKDVSFEVGAGEVFALLGQNGAGKTTTIKMCVGLLSPDAGRIRINGLDPQKDRGAGAAIGALLEGNRNIYWRMTPFENLRYFGVLKGMSIAEASAQARALLERFGLSGRSRQQVHQLSRGMMQKLAIAVALLNRPRVLFLDEPTLGLDVGSVAQMLDIIRELAAEGSAIVLTTHQLDIAENLSDRIAIIHHGSVVKTSRTQELTREYSPFGYEICMAQALDADAKARLEGRFDARVVGEKVYLPDEGELLYEVLQALRPAAVEHVGRRKADLTEIFLRLTGEHVDA
ncbi:ABC transporter ATP-binding protein [Xanthomonas bonasiae]|uniref:ABC transporter ATP-binding protein n=1 Tax=Xanthomonas bonasiae TaxID=2810351 RepID=UPI00197CF8A4|nr:ABC transporter ATP-binding protein [Xanthomonas bonasiae]MBN6111418.1 ABC transporter ATP-binding protein [Xanthomonas bonasiae]